MNRDIQPCQKCGSMQHIRQMQVETEAWTDGHCYLFAYCQACWHIWKDLEQQGKVGWPKLTWTYRDKQ